MSTVIKFDYIALAYIQGVCFTHYEQKRKKRLEFLWGRWADDIINAMMAHQAQTNESRSTKCLLGSFLTPHDILLWCGVNKQVSKIQADNSISNGGKSTRCLKKHFIRFCRHLLMPNDCKKMWTSHYASCVKYQGCKNSPFSLWKLNSTRYRWIYSLVTL